MEFEATQRIFLCATVNVSFACSGDVFQTQLPTKTIIKNIVLRKSDFNDLFD